jgi:Carboxypeptidase regulatory-like domain
MRALPAKLQRRGFLQAALGLGFVSHSAAGADRTVEGTVFFKGGEPAAGVAVQLHDKTTLEVVSHISDKDGRFKFVGLNPDKDYDLRATRKGHWSKTHSISRFSSRPVETVKLYLAAEPEE